jgi:hypothetical protein
MESHGNVMGISWEYYGEIKGISISSRIHIYLYLYIYIFIYLHTYIYILFGISWISIEMIKLPSNHRIYQNWGYAINHQIIGVCPKI